MIPSRSFPCCRWSLLLPIALLSVGLTASSHAQTEVVPAVTPTTQLPDPNSPVQVVPSQQQTTTTTTTVQPGAVVAPAAPAVVPAPEVLAPGEHVVDIEMTVARGSVQAYFGRAAKREGVSIGDLNISVKVPSTATVAKLLSRDKDSDGPSKITRDNPWVARARFSGPGRYVFNMVEWDDDPVVVSLVLRVDGQVVFSGHGRSEELKNWPDTTYGPGVSRSGTREIAFVLD